VFAFDLYMTLACATQLVKWQVMVFKIMPQAGVRGCGWITGTKLKTAYQVARMGTVSGAARCWACITPP